MRRQVSTSIKVFKLILLVVSTFFCSVVSPAFADTMAESIEHKHKCSYSEGCFFLYDEVDFYWSADHKDTLQIYFGVVSPKVRFPENVKSFIFYSATKTLVMVFEDNSGLAVSEYINDEIAYSLGFSKQIYLAKTKKFDQEVRIIEARIYPLLHIDPPKVSTIEPVAPPSHSDITPEQLAAGALGVVALACILNYESCIGSSGTKTTTSNTDNEDAYARCFYAAEDRLYRCYVNRSFSLFGSGWDCPGWSDRGNCPAKPSFNLDSDDEYTSYYCDPQGDGHFYKTREIAAYESCKQHYK
ncbi:MAG: hypothetical protein KDC43_14890 [Saprospiraceae bacterium]|nr:hypothetical protein [Saprospiraceae bacterium]